MMNKLAPIAVAVMAGFSTNADAAPVDAAKATEEMQKICTGDSVLYDSNWLLQDQIVLFNCASGSRTAVSCEGALRKWKTTGQAGFKAQLGLAIMGECPEEAPIVLTIQGLEIAQP